MSFAVSGTPSFHFTPVRIWKVQVRPSLLVSQEVARPPSVDGLMSLGDQLIM